MDHELIEKQFYEKYWKSVNRTFSKDPNHFSSKKPFRYVKEFSLNKNGFALDIGCGNGRHTKIFKKSIGIDVSESSCKFAKINAKKPILKASILHSPFKSHLFNIVIDSGCMHHLRKSQFSLYKKNLIRLIKKEGHFLLLCFSINSGRIKKFTPHTKNKNYTLRSGHYNHFFTEKELRHLFRKDFKILKLKEVKNPNSELRFYAVHAQKT